MWMIDSGFEVLLILLLGGVVMLLKFVEQGPPEGWMTSLHHARAGYLADDAAPHAGGASVGTSSED